METKFLVPQDTYLKSGIHIGTKFKTKFMESFIYKTRNDGLSVLNLQKIDERIVIAASFMSNFSPKDILIASRRENGWKPVTAFSDSIGCKCIAGRYQPGLLTNPNLENYSEIKLLFVVDASPDRNVVADAVKVGTPVMSLCDTNNHSNFIDFVVPCNNKGKKSLGLFFWILAREYLKNRNMLDSDWESKHPLTNFTEE